MSDVKLDRQEVDVTLLDPNPLNPNEMTDKEFNLLYDNIERMGVTDPILVRTHPEKEGRYRIIGGEHRWEVAKLMGFETVPCTIVQGDFTDDDEAFQLVRHNVIKGRMSPKKFMSLYQSLTEDYSEEVAAEMFGFAEQEEFAKLVKSTKDSLPPEMQDDFEKASKEIKSIDDLSKVLNELFATFGDTLPHAYMIIDFGGKESIWLRIQPGMRKQFMEVAAKCREKSKSMDHFFDRLLHTCAQGPTEVDFDAILDQCPDVDVGDDEDVTPTLDFLDESL